MSVKISSHHQQLLPLLKDVFGISMHNLNLDLFTTHETKIEEIELLRGLRKHRELTTIMYNLYSAGYLTILGHKYPRYEAWKNAHKHGDQRRGEVTLDHILPKSEYPSLAFDHTNWQVMTQEANKAKGSDYSTADLDRVLGQ
jgi:hypothetical protein